MTKGLSLRHVPAGRSRGVTNSQVSLLGSIFVWLVVPETKGRTLEEIEKSWIKHP
jgi:hypothetical protein